MPDVSSSRHSVCGASMETALTYGVSVVAAVAVTGAPFGLTFVPSLVLMLYVAVLPAPTVSVKDIRGRDHSRERTVCTEIGSAVPRRKSS